MKVKVRLLSPQIDNIEIIKRHILLHARTEYVLYKAMTDETPRHT